MGIGSNLWSWQRAQPSVSPRKARPTVSTCSSTMSISIFCSSTSASTFGPRARKPVAISRSRARRRASAGGQQVAGELLEDELVVRLVGVERGDDVVAVAPGVAVGDVLVQAVGVGVAGHVEPVPAPALAVARRGEQPVDDPGEGVRASRRRGRRRSPRASAAGRSGRTWPGGSGSACPPPAPAQALRFQPREDEAVERRPRPAASATAGDGRVTGARSAQRSRPRLESAAGPGGSVGVAPRIGGTHGHPASQHLDFAA